METPELLDERETANILKISVAKLQRDRWSKTGIPFIKLGRIVRYKKDAILSYCDFHTQYNTSERE